MGQVISIEKNTRVGEGDSVLTFIAECYRKLDALPDFSARPGQQDLSIAICKALVAGEPIVAEAPTGTGKTLAYLVGAIAASEKLRTTKDIPIVVATATVGLQSQVLTGDIPKLKQAGIVGDNDAVVAKGRHRYFCAMAAERLLEGQAVSAQVDFFDHEANKTAEDLGEVSVMLEQWQGHAWSGDMDSYQLPTKAWGRVAACADTCLSHKCDHYNTCPFFNSRRALSSAKILVANHDLVFADLTMDKDGQDALFPGKKYLLIFDEAHHLPDKAVSVGAAELAVGTLMNELMAVAQFSRAWQKHIDVLKLFEKQKIRPEDFDIAYVMNALGAVMDEAALPEVDETTFQYRFEQGVLPPALLLSLQMALSHLDTLKDVLVRGTQALKQCTLGEKRADLKQTVTDLLYQAAGANALLAKAVRALKLITSKTRAVRWVFRSADKLSIHTSPLEGAEVLKDLLWSSERVATAMVSATVQDFNGFERFLTRAGAPSNTRTMALPHIFPYGENTIYLVETKSSPRQDERLAFKKELIESLPRFIDDSEGTLILFPSRSMMCDLTPCLRQKFGSKVLCQDDLGIKELIKEHKTRVDGGAGSILCGLATLAEGLDLPGNYCTHVVIIALPFTVPTSPVERELQDVLGKDYFMKRSLPDALIKLTQMVGRLMRRESDRGRITVFDKRLSGTRWGEKMLNALPEFRRKRVSPSAPPPFLKSVG
jgi:ATP-dependent DNA helicase DinG